MFDRCYNEKNKTKNSTYKECTVGERRHNFQNFAKWFDENYNFKTMNKWHLDKDILVKGNKVYSPETCCFVPAEINSLFIKRDSCRGYLPIGVRKSGKVFQARLNKTNISEHLGTFKTPEEAFEAYKTAKE